ncbi:NAD(P)/FAD-dependent oxidoreductase [Haloimpatiens sp. FM7330]|uniref:NAD(P)/FAD-dependent oxidoreductase n=1 Tax=Haloimpatiens sp. FM7330 TaxID=3298610 RepID=UPI003628FE4C
MSELLKKIQTNIQKKVSKNIFCKEFHSSILLEGNVNNWDEVVKAGIIAANKGYKGVINHIQIDNFNKLNIRKPLIEDGILNKKKVDVLIIGGGIIGCAIARELSKWQFSILLVDKESDVAMHASSRNDGMVHPGIVPKPGSKKALFNVRGNKLYSKVTKELDVPFKRCGSIILLDNNFLKLAYPYLKIRAWQNNVEGIKKLSLSQIREMEPNVIQKGVCGGILIPSTGVVSPYNMTIAYGENAVDNGCEISLNTIVMSMKLEKNKIVMVRTNRGNIYPKVVINAAGVYSDKIAAMANDEFFSIHPRKGEIALLDKKKGYLINSVIAKPKLNINKTHTKGGGIVRTIDDNLLIGPDAYEQPYREDFSTNRENINSILKRQLNLLSNVKKSDVITYFSGIRAATYEEDFIVEKSEYVKNLVHAAGIQSPGVASAPAIAEEIEKITYSILCKNMMVKSKKNWKPNRKKIPRLSKMSVAERAQLIKKNPDYGVVICRCEEISKGEIIDAIKSPIPATTVDAVKRRVRTGMGRCQGGFCMPQVMKIIREETGIELDNVTKKGNKSYILDKETK